MKSKKCLVGVSMVRRILMYIFTCVLVMGMVIPSRVFADDYLEEEPFLEAFSPGQGSIGNKLPVVDAAAAVVMDTKSGRILFDKNCHQRRSIASTTKIITAVVALENGNLEDIVTVSKRAADIWGSTVGIEEGEKYTLRELLYGLMLKSGNDAAIAIAEHIAGSVEDFAVMMTQKAKQIGAKDSAFTTPHGLDQEGHYSTAYDLALIARYALQKPVFREIVATTETNISNKHLSNTNEMLTAYPGADGVKTGYTGKAGRCLVTSATRDQWQIISVVLGCASRTKRAIASRNILDYAFHTYTPVVLLQKGEALGTVAVKKGRMPVTAVEAENEIVLPLTQQEKEQLQKIVEIPDSLDAPVEAGTAIGKVQFTAGEKILAQASLKIIHSVARKNILDYVSDVFKDWFQLMRYENG